MKALAINGSARGAKGFTQSLLDNFGNGLKAGGAHLDILQAVEINPARCNGCLDCLHKHPGVCAQNDGMDQVYGLLKEADLFIVAAPLYMSGLPSLMKAVLERCLCSLLPFMTTDAKGNIRRQRAWEMPPDFLLLSNCGFPEPENFSPLIQAFKAQAEFFGCRSLAELCIPGSLAMQLKGSITTKYCFMLMEAGRKLAENGVIDPELIRRINTRPVEAEEFRRITHRYERRCSKKLGIAKNR